MAPRGLQGLDMAPRGLQGLEMAPRGLQLTPGQLSLMFRQVRLSLAVGLPAGLILTWLTSEQVDAASGLELLSMLEGLDLSVGQVMLRWLTLRLAFGQSVSLALML